VKRRRSYSASLSGFIESDEEAGTRRADVRTRLRQRHYSEAVTSTDDRPDLPAEYAELHSALDDKMGFELLALTPQRVVGRVPVAGNTQPYGLWHGGASCVLAETLASLGSFIYAQPERISVGVDINATHHRSVTAGWVTGTATALHLGRSVACYEIVITNDADERVCTARVTCQLVPPRGA
jgi:1,4-dihydroxy-2-naphthoyl-CoA hydrolase